MLKLLAALFMLIDHIGYYFKSPLNMPDEIYFALRAAGRLAFPIFAYYIARGYARTKNPGHYLFRMMIFALITDGMMRVCEYITGEPAYVNVLFTFFAALLILHLWKSTIRPTIIGDQNKDQHVANRIFTAILSGFLIFVIMIFVYAFNTDYSLYGVAMVLCFSAINNSRLPKDRTGWQRLLLFIAVIGGLNLLFFSPSFYPFVLTDNLQWLSLLATPFFLLDRDLMRPARGQKYFFYIFYPAHIGLLIMLAYLITSYK